MLIHTRLGDRECAFFQRSLHLTPPHLQRVLFCSVLAGPHGGWSCGYSLSNMLDMLSGSAHRWPILSAGLPSDVCTRSRVLVAAKCSDSVWLSGGYHARLLFTQRASLCVHGSVEPDLILRTSGCTVVRASTQASNLAISSALVKRISCLPVGALCVTVVLVAVGALASAM